MDQLTKNLVATIGHLYEIAHELAPAVWVEAYEKIAAVFDADGLGAITIYDRAKDEMISMEGRIDPELLPKYLDELQRKSPLRPSFSRLRIGERMNRADVLSDEEFIAHPTYELFYRKAKIFQLEYRVFLEDGSIYAGIVLTRSRGKPNFSEAEIEALDLLMPHLARAFKLRFRIAHVDKQNNIITSLIDRVPGGVLVVDRKKKLEYANAAAREIFGAKDGIVLTPDDVVVADRPAAENDLRRAVEKIIDGPDRRGEATVSIERGSGKRPYELLLIRLTAADGSPFPGEPRVSIYVSDASYEPNQDGEMLVRMFDLTRSESRVAMLLAGGRSLNQIAEDLSISKHTARTHLKRVLSKTNTHSQGELIRLLLTGPAALRPASGPNQ